MRRQQLTASHDSDETMTKAQTILVTGASGQLGHLVLDALLANADVKIVAATRTPEKLAQYVSQGVEVRIADFNDASTLKSAFVDVERLLLISTDAIGTRIQQHQNAINAARTAKVRHVVYTSWPNPDRSATLVAREHLATETLLKESGMGYTVLRNYPYAESLLRSLPAAIQAGALHGSAGAGRIAYVTRADCARAAAGALLSSDESNTIVNVTGRDAVTYEELMSVVSELVGKTIPYVNVPADQLKTILLKSGLPEMWANVLVSFDQAIERGEFSETSNAVKRLSGHDAEPLRAFLSRHQTTLLNATHG